MMLPLCATLFAASTSAASPSSPCFVAGDTLGVELHCVAVMAMATPQTDPMQWDTPMQIASTVPTSTWSTKPAIAAQTIQAEPVPNTLELFERFATWFNQDLTDSNVWMAIVH